MCIKARRDNDEIGTELFKTWQDLRIERLAKLIVRAGRRVRRDVRDQDDKINILIDLHLQNEERFAKNEERFARNEKRFAKQDERFARQDAKIEMILDLQRKTEERFHENQELFRENQELFRENEERFRQSEERFRQNEERFAKTDERFVESRAETDRRFNALIDILRERPNDNA